MSQPVKLSDALVLDARQTGSVAERSIAGQIEFWARLGRAVETLLSGDRVLALRRAGDQQPLSSLIATVSAPKGHQRVAEFLSTQPFPHYEPVEDQAGLLVRIEENGRRTLGKFHQGEFQPAKTKQSKKTERKGRS
ncbi:TA system antitoxin ParD family protein [Bythopirellula goksoeyrii]|uniref:ParD-like antitoxin of type II toxin-antitoxin system n=1 Tax=Bythopirellula goksoeyrii TaxID=1400387 RepID=A0A5B9QU34_9BACT|nr:hypothetical protein [Bythopirellula goksoeyrii]QEG37433.1 hypothetical protein Pr1d_47780 [Bythopirellula goksoeyrii]